MIPFHAWYDPGDGTLEPCLVLGRSMWPGTWRVQVEGSQTKLVRAVMDHEGNVRKP